MNATRRLAAILVADVADFSRLMEADETGTVAALKERRKAILEPVVKAQGVLERPLRPPNLPLEPLLEQTGRAPGPLCTLFQVAKHAARSRPSAEVAK